MKPTLTRIFALLSLLLLVNGASAANVLKADNATTLNLAGSWVGGVVPGASDFATWDSTVSAGNCSVSFAAVETIGGIKIINPGANVTIPFGNNSKPTLNGVSGVGIDASAATVDLDIEVGLYLGGNQTWTVAAGHSVTHANSTGNLFFQGHTLTFAGAGTNIINSMQSGGAAGIVMNGPGSLTMKGVTAYALNMSVTLNGGKLNLNGQVGAASGSTVTLIINGGTNDNTSAGALTLNNNPPVTINGDFTFAGTQGLNWGTGAVTLGTAAGTTRTITANANTLTLGGAIGNGTTAINLTKAGAGTLTLSGANTYSGATTVSAGTLNTTTASTGAGSYAVSDGATLGVSIASAGQTVNMSSLTLGSAAGPSTLNLTLGANNPTATVITDAGALALNGTVTVNVLGGASLTPSSVVLLSYGSGGAGTFVAGTLPNVSGYVPHLTNDTSAKQLMLTFAPAAAPVQWAVGNGNWDTTTANWQPVGGGSAVKYIENNPVTFDDNGLGSGPITVTLTANHTPTSVINNSTKNYILTNSAITGSASLTKSGSSTLTLYGANTYSGGTTLSAGTLVANNNTALGSGQLTMSGGALSNSVGSTLNNNIDLSSAGTVGVASGQTLTLGGAITDTGGLSLTGPGVLTLSGANTYTGGTTLGAGTLVANNNTPLGSSGTIEFTGNSTLTWGNLFTTDLSSRLKIDDGVTATIDTGSNNVTFVHALQLGGSGTGALTKEGSGALLYYGTSDTFSGNTTISNGVIAIASNGKISPASTVYQSGGQLYLQVGPLTLPNDCNLSSLGPVERFDTNAAIGAIRVDGVGSILSGTITLSGDSRIGSAGGQLTLGGQITGPHAISFYDLNTGNNSAAVFTLSNPNNNYTGNTQIDSHDYQSAKTGCRNTLMLGASDVIPNGAGAGNIAFDGTDADHLTILEMNGYNDTVNGFTVTAAAGAQIQNTLNGASILTVGDNDTTSIFPGTIVDGGVSYPLALVKIGTGTLTLSGANTYTGDTVISNGTLVISTRQAGNGNFGVASGAALSVTNTGASTTAAVSSLTLGDSTLGFQQVADPTTPLVTDSGALTVDGATTIVITGTRGLVTGNVYPLISASSISGSGGFSLSIPSTIVANLVTNGGNTIALNVTSAVNTNPTNITAVVSGNVLQLSWPADHTGWRLLVQTNNLAKGISSNTNDWMTVPGSTGINSTNITMNPTLPTEFYRLVYP